MRACAAMLTQHTIEETDEERMSTEENPNEEDVKPVKRSVLKRARSLLDYWQVGLKLLELVSYYIPINNYCNKSNKNKHALSMSVYHQLLKPSVSKNNNHTITQGL